MCFDAEYEKVSPDNSKGARNPSNTDEVDNDVGNDGDLCCVPDRSERNDGLHYTCSPTGCSPDHYNSNGPASCYPCNPCSPQEHGYFCSPDQGENHSPTSSSDDSGCFITTACIEALHLPDDCDELQTLRVLRDKRRLYDSQFNGMVEEYYQIAPAIVSAINRSAERKTCYLDIYEHMILPCVKLIKQNRENDAVALYAATIIELKGRYSEV